MEPCEWILRWIWHVMKPVTTSSDCLISVGDEKYKIFLSRDWMIKKIATKVINATVVKNIILFLTFDESI